MSVAIIRWTGPESVGRAMDAVGAWESFKPGMDVFIKPNIVMAGSLKIPAKGITTSPDVVEAILHLVRQKGAGTVRIGDGSIHLPSLKMDTRAAFRWSGMEDLSQREKVPLVDLNEGPFRTFFLSDGTEIEIAASVLEADFVINVPVLKTHNQTVTTVCLKNLKGCLSTDSKKKCHRETDLNRAVAEFNLHIPCHVNVVDALTAAEIGPLPTGRRDQVREMGLILAGKDRLECDIVGSSLLGYPAEEVPHIVHYGALTGKSLKMEDIRIIGEDPSRYRLALQYRSQWLEDLMEKFSVSGMEMPSYGLPLCSHCGVNLWAGLMTFCKTHQGKNIDGAELLAGKNAIPGGKARHSVLLGKCAIKKNKKMKDAIKVPGCPPDPGKVLEIMTKALITGS
ncbi:MAG: DUF362 domain-containing protein [Pseudomonadota bacterium]